MYNSDLKKLVQWFTILKENDAFPLEQEAEEEEAPQAEAPKAEEKEEAPKKKAAKSPAKASSQKLLPRNNRMKEIAVIGAGTMGNGIAHVFAQSGFNVTLIDVQDAALERALAPSAATSTG